MEYRENIKNSNLKLFNKIFERLEKRHLVFLSSNSGTGKTTFYKWLFIRRAFKGKIKFDVYFRYENEIETKFNDSAWLKLPTNASKRKQKLSEKVTIISEDGNYFLINKETKEKLAQALALNTQKKYKSTENAIYSDYALFDEVMPDDNSYCPNEVYKFSRLIDTRARNRSYKVLCLYNNTRPFFPYKESFGKTKALFYDFIGEKFGQPENKGIQEILATSDYGEVYTNNSYQYYKEFFRDVDSRNCETIVSLCIQNHIFNVKSIEEYFILKKAKKVKKNIPILALNMEGNSFELVDTSSRIYKFLDLIIRKRLLFADKKKNTIFVKELADFFSIMYNN